MYTTHKSISQSWQIEPNLDYNYTFPLIWHQMEFRLVPNQREKCNDN